MLIPPERQPEEDAVLAAILRGERVAPFATMRIARGGRRFHVNLTVAAVRDARGAIVGVSQIARAVTGPPASAIQAYLAAIVESSDDGILSKDLDGIVTSCNPAAERIFGYSPAELVGQSIRVLIPPDRQAEEGR